MRERLSNLATAICPPILLPPVKAIYRVISGRAQVIIDPHSQDLDVYWTDEMQQVLETWGEGNVWSEIQLAMAGRKGKALDIACGTGKVTSLLQYNKDLEIWGVDISDKFIDKAAQRGLDQSRLFIGDALDLPFEDNFFDYSYSIGSIEHFTEDGIATFLKESDRVTNSTSFHMHPVSKSGENEGWIKTVQSYFNNSVDWWLPKYREAFSSVVVLDSLWEDHRSKGKWFVCSNL